MEVEYHSWMNINSQRNKQWVVPRRSLAKAQMGPTSAAYPSACLAPKLKITKHVQESSKWIYRNVTSTDSHIS